MSKPMPVPRRKIGQRVWMTDYGVQQGLLGRAKSRWGTVVSTRSLEGLGYIRVRRDGLKGSELYSVTFWEVRSNA